MATRVVEGKKPYTGGKAITVDENKVISLNLRDENNLIIYDEGDDEIYVDLQLPDGIKPTDAFPVGITTGRVLVADDWDITGTIICAKTTSGDNIKLLYGDDGTLWIDNGTGIFKQIYFKADVDSLISTLTTYINTELAKKQNGVSSNTEPEDPAQGDLWYDSANDRLMVYDGTSWNLVGGGSGSGDVIGPSSAVDGHLAVFDGVSGKIIKDGGAVPTVPTNVSDFNNDAGYITGITSGDVTTALGYTPADSSALGTAATKNTGTSSGNVPVLDSNGKLATSTLPGVALTDTFTVSTSSDLTSLSSADQGDIAIVTTENKTYVLSQAPYSTASNWKQILSPTGGVTSWNGQTGAVTYTAPVTSVNGQTGAVTVPVGDVVGPASATDLHLAVFDGATGKLIKDGGVVPTGVPSGGTDGQVLTQTNNGPAWQNATGGADIEYKTQAEYNALLPGALTDNKHYFIYSTSGGGGWQPGVDTTMYFKFNGDLKDEISGITHTASGITYGTLTSGNQYAIFPGGSNGCFSISNNLTDSGDEITILLWFQVSNTNNMRNEFSNASGGYYTGLIFQNGNLGAYYYDNNNDIYGGSSWSDQLYNANERHLYGQTIKASGKIKMFLDGVKVGEKNMEASLRGSADGAQYIGTGRTGSGSYFSGKMSEFIVEKVEWVETDISNYFNQTKANYGIS